MDAETSAEQPDELVERLLHHRAWLCALARALVRDPGAADDVVQETFAAALAHPPTGPLRPWLATVARRAALVWRRGEARRSRREEQAARPEATPSADELVERIEAEERLVRALRHLAEPFRSTVLLRYHEGLAAADIARRQGVPEGTVRWRTKRGLDELRMRLEREFGGREALGVVLVRLARDAAPWAGALGGAWTIMGGKGLVAAGAAAALLVAAVAMRVGAGESSEDARTVVNARVHESDTGRGTASGPTDIGAVAAEREELDAVADAHRAPWLRILESDGAPNAERLVLVARGGAERPAALRTDDAGRIELPTGAGACGLVVERSGAFPYRTSLDVHPGTQELVLPEEVVLAGRIVVDGKAPVRPLALELFAADSAEERVPAPATEELALDVDFVRTRTDAGGRFSIRGARADRGYAVRLPYGYVLPDAPPSAGAVPPQFHVPRPRRDLVFEVQRLPGLQGRIVEADGRTPSAGVVDCRFTWINGTNMNEGATAGDDGWFDLPVPEPWRAISLELWGTPGVRGRTTVVFAREEIGDDGMLGDLRLAEGRGLVLHVVDRDGDPVEGAYTDQESAPTDASGTARLRDVTADALRVAARGFREARVELLAGAEEVEVTLEPAPELFLEVRDAGGDPLPGLLVELNAPRWPFDAETPSMLLSAHREGRLLSWSHGPFVGRYVTDSGGRLRIDALLAGVTFELRALAPGSVVVDERAVPPLAPEERRVVSLELATAATELRLRVVDDAGAPVEGARLELPMIRSGTLQAFSGSFWSGPSLESDAAGRITCRLLDLPGLHLTVTHPNFLPLGRDLARIPREEIELVLERGFDVRVSVVDANGRAQPGGGVCARRPGGRARVEAVERGTGEFEVRCLRDELQEFVLSIGGGEFVHAQEAHVPELAFRVPVMGAVAASWELAQGGAQEFLWIELWSADGGKLVGQEAYFDTPRGEHRFDPVLPGDYDIVLKLDERVLARERVRVAAAETARAALAP